MPAKRTLLIPGAEDVFEPVVLTPHQIAEYIARYIYTIRNYSPQSIGTYKRCLREFVYYVASVDRAFRFTPACVERYRDYLLRRKRRQRGKGVGLTEVAMSQYLTALRRFCEFLVVEGVLTKNPARSVSGGKRPSRYHRRALTLAELDALLSVLDGNTEEIIRDRAMILLMLGAGLSEIEIHNLDIGDFECVGKVWYARVRGKGKHLKVEKVAIPQPAMEAIEQYRSLFGEQEPTAPLFRSMSKRSRGKRLSIRSIHVAIEEQYQRAGIRDEHDKLRLTPFSLRHTGGIILAESGVPIEYLMERWRIYWRPTAERYYKLAGTLGSNQRPDIQQLVLIPRHRRTQPASS
ncbi:MAG: tyrosine-type recombinase/integrase [Bacteroidota bacterium]|nr:tyrosine-type recombinase/integrase [Candidatus Kapabacteria bacterium]MCS7301984.1 tyrosine-type recombinase/integrase [Candidatus Kapabacteria bacterium]MCX7936560.1 tyrosine-type recombinase/integrase [Chlorobiota bacterium]MDW8074753.1 tyrosine-type recombinase/integrase [Bacteroidota bacterium]MDW8271392.1 tyrosine-type recombinase/integrase [Bacteroidota bacterium]